VRERRGVDLNGAGKPLYVHTGTEMVRHLFRVASSIDSMILGEAQILGQVHDAFGIADRAGTAGPLLHRLLDAAFRVGKRVRSETEVSVGAVSVASAAISLTSHIFWDMEARSALLVGSGETGALAARHLKQQGIGKILVANRTFERAETLARELDAVAVPYQDLEQQLASVSIVVTATSSPTPILRHEMVRRVMAGRRNRPLLILDIAVPRDVEPAVKGLGNVFLYDLDDLQELVNRNLERRRQEIPKVEAIIEHEIEQFLRWYGGLGAAPVIRELRERFERLRADEVEKHAHRFCEKDRVHVDALTRSLVNKLLHEPSTSIRHFHKHGANALVRLETVRELFGLTNDGKRKEDADDDD
jgi:glutamyl-tRNA reductase